MWLVVVALAGAALLGGELLRLSEPDLPEPTSTAPVAVPTTALTRTEPTAAPSRVAEHSASSVPLAETMPGFVDTITTLTWDYGGIDIVRWRAEQPAAEKLVSLGHGDGSRSRSLDASGKWFSEIREDSALTVQAVSDSGYLSEPLAIEEPTGGQLWSAVWHDTRPGRLAWLACNSEASSGILRSIDLTAEAAQSTAMRIEGLSCEDRDVWLTRWGDWGILLHRSEQFGTTQMLLNPEGTEIADGRLDPEGEWFVGIGPGRTTVWTEGLETREASSFLLSRDGRHGRPVPGLAPGERLESAQISPDGSLLALIPDLVANYGSVVRIVEADTDAVIAEITQPSSWVSGMVWTADSRFLVFQRWPDVTTNWAGVPQDVELVFFDTDTRTGAALPLADYAPVLRSAG